MSESNVPLSVELCVFRADAWQYNGPVASRDAHLVPKWVHEAIYPCEPFTAACHAALFPEWLSPEANQDNVLRAIKPGDWLVRNIDGRVFLFSDAEFRRYFRRVSG